MQTRIHGMSSEEKHTSTRVACDENPICHAEATSFSGCESFRRRHGQRLIPTEERELQEVYAFSVSAQEGMTEMPPSTSLSLSSLWPDGNMWK